MNTRACKVCGMEKLFAQGTWVISRGKPTGRICLACHTAKWSEYYRAHSAAKLLDPTAKQKQQEASKLAMRRRRATTIGKAQMQAANRLWYSKNRTKGIAQAVQRQNNKLKRSPAWLSIEDRLQIASMYELAKIMEACTGEKYHVDHVTPLQGKRVSGLHVPYNLQILPAAINISKGNRYEL